LSTLFYSSNCIKIFTITPRVKNRVPAQDATAGARLAITVPGVVADERNKKEEDF